MEGNEFQSLGKRVKKEYWEDLLVFKQEYCSLKALADLVPVLIKEKLSFMLIPEEGSLRDLTKNRTSFSS